MGVLLERAAFVGVKFRRLRRRPLLGVWSGVFEGTLTRRSVE
jgi:hypothetical protein